jgi:hypothetical protein
MRLQAAAGTLYGSMFVWMILPTLSKCFIYQRSYSGVRIVHLHSQILQ